MVKATSLSGNGLRDWLIQRATAVILLIYLLFLVGFLAMHTPLEYADWYALFKHTSMRIFTLLALLSMVYHTWIGMWTVFTDYIKYAAFRGLLQGLTIVALFSYLIWGASIVWSL